MKLNIFYSMDALGKNGAPIRIYKFRSMTLDANEHLDDVVLNGVDELGKIKNDPRITKLGKFLRKYWIDESPQLYNLAKREIRLIGIRPKSKEIWLRYSKEHKERTLKYKPGLMGILYAHVPLNNSEDITKEITKIESSYLEQKDLHPYKTDVKYFLTIVYRIIFKGLRSR